jgi:hypothetical protein
MKVLWSRSRGAEIKLPPGTGVEITNCGSGSFLFTTDVRIFFIEKKSWFLKKVKKDTVIFKVFYTNIRNLNSDLRML